MQAGAHRQKQIADRPGRHRLVRLLGWLGAAVVLLLSVGVMLLFGATHFQNHPEVIVHWQNLAGGVKWWGILVQTLLLGLLIAGWQRFVDWLIGRQWLPQAERTEALAFRWRVLAFGTAYLLLVVIGPSTLWRALVR